MPEPSRKFDKKALTLDEQVILLRERGLVMDDEGRVRHYLKNIGYYHLSGYMAHFQHCDLTDSSRRSDDPMLDD